MTYKTMADKLGLSATAVKKRITKLLERGVIDRFITTLNYEMIDSDLLLSIIQTDGSEFQEDFIDEMGKNPSVIQVSSVACGKGGLYSVCSIRFWDICTNFGISYKCRDSCSSVSEG
ncbi:MAG: Lrp/AsnC family transcriptional regulator [Candidatus Thorarchaeota archaeon]